jgi:hypothetical protein
MRPRQPTTTNYVGLPKVTRLTNRRAQATGLTLTLTLTLYYAQNLRERFARVCFALTKPNVRLQSAHKTERASA